MVFCDTAVYLVCTVERFPYIPLYIIIFEQQQLVHLRGLPVVLSSFPRADRGQASYLPTFRTVERKVSGPTPRPDQHSGS